MEESFLLGWTLGLGSYTLRYTKEQACCTKPQVWVCLATDSALGWVYCPVGWSRASMPCVLEEALKLAGCTSNWSLKWVYRTKEWTR